MAGTGEPSQAEILAELDEPRLSLLDVVRQRAEVLGLLEKIHRVLIAVKYGKPGDSGDSLKDVIESIRNSQESADEQGGVLTGILLMFPLCCLLLLEGPQRLVVGTLTSLKEHQTRSSDMIGSMHLLISIQDAPGRSFKSFSSRSLQMSKADGIVPEREQMLTMVPDISVNLQKFGRKVRFAAAYSLHTFI